jgi:hypothetical protein
MAVFVDNQGKSWYLLDDDDGGSAGPSTPNSGMSGSEMVSALEAPASAFPTGPAAPQQEAPPALPPPTHAQQVQAQGDVALTQQFMADNRGQPQMSASPAAAAAHLALPAPAAAGSDAAAPAGGAMTPMQQIEAYAGMRPPPISSGPPVMELTGSTTTTNTVYGRNKKLAEADASALDQAGQTGDAALLNAGKAKDERLAASMDVEKAGLQNIQDRNQDEVINQKLAQQTAEDR